LLFKRNMDYLYMTTIDKMYAFLIKVGYESMYLQSLTDKEMKELYMAQTAKGEKE